MKLENKNILIISPEKWGENFVSKHHYAQNLSSKNKIFFLNPPSGYSINPFKKSVFLKDISDNIKQIDYLNPIPKLDRFPKSLRRLVFKIIVKRILKSISPIKIDLVWSFDPYRFQNPEYWCANTNIYHSVDAHSIDEIEIELAKKSDLVVAVSPDLTTHFPKSLKPLIIGHGFDNKSNAKFPSELPGQNSIKGVNIGNYNRLVDYDLILSLAKDHPNVDFIYVGPTSKNNLGDDHEEIQSKFSELRELKNVYFLGPVPHSQINDLLSKTSFNLVIYKEELKISNTHKMLSFIYSGKPTISSFISDYSDIDPDIVRIAKSNKLLTSLISEVVDDYENHFNPALQEKRRNFALERTYDKRIEEIENTLFKKM